MALCILTLPGLHLVSACIRTPSLPLQVVGGAEAYTAACRACFRSLTWEKGQAVPLTERNRRPQAQRQATVHLPQGSEHACAVPIETHLVGVGKGKHSLRCPLIFANNGVAYNRQHPRQSGLDDHAMLGTWCHKTGGGPGTESVHVLLCRNITVKTRSASGRAKQRQHERDENTPTDAIVKTERRLSGLSLR